MKAVLLQKGSTAPPRCARDIPRLVSLTESGKFDLGLMVSKRVRIEEVNTAMAALDGGEVIRSVIVF